MSDLPESATIDRSIARPSEEEQRRVDMRHLYAKAFAAAAAEDFEYC